MKKDVSTEFESELRSFFVLSLFNIVFGALAMAFGIQFVVTAGLSLQAEPMLPVPLFVQVLVGITAAVLGFRWIRSTVKIFRGVKEVRNEYRALEKPVEGIALTGLILRMISHYRENKTTILAMTVICALGGIVYLALGITNVFQGISAVISSGEAPAFFFIAAAVNLVIGLVSLRSSTWFRRYSSGWESRLEEISRSEEILKRSLDGEHA